MSDLDVVKACKIMNAGKYNEQVGNDNGPCVLVTNERAQNAVAGAWSPMSDRESGLGCHVGAEVKKFGTDVMKTHGGEYGFILYWLKYKMHCMKEVTGWINVSCAMGNILFVMFGLLFVFCL